MGNREWGVESRLESKAACQYAEIANNNPYSLFPICLNFHFANFTLCADAPKFGLYLFAFDTFDDGECRAYPAARTPYASRVD